MWGLCKGASILQAYRRRKARRHSAFLLSNTVRWISIMEYSHAAVPLVPSLPLGVSEYDSTRLRVGPLHLIRWESRCLWMFSPSRGLSTRATRRPGRIGTLKGTKYIVPVL
jgi:hypothetical protein